MGIIQSLKFLAVIAFVLGNPTNDEYVQDSVTNRTYKIMYKSQVWNTAKLMCENEGARLAVPKSQEEFKFIQSLVRGMQYMKITGTTYKQLVWIGINNLQDYRIWKNLDGENIDDTGYHQWAGENGKGFSDNPAEPHCAGMDPINPGLRDWWCHRPQPYICEKTL